MDHLQGGNSMSRIKEILFWVVALGFTVGFIVGFRALTTPPVPAVVAVTTSAPVPSEPAGEPSPPEDAPSIDDAAIAMAAETAQGYLDTIPLSRDGLIGMLTLADQNVYPADIAIAAVDSLGVDWNEQAVLAARTVEPDEASTRAELVAVLTAEFPTSMFTQLQAEYAADQIGF
jgi:hypothetical protein